MAYNPNVSIGQFAEVRTSEKTPILELNPNFPIANLREDVITTNGGTVNDPDRAEYILQTSSGGDFSEIRSRERGRYVPGTAAEAGMRVRIPDLNIGDGEILWAYYDTDSNNNVLNALGFGYNSTDGVFITRVKGGTQKEKVPESSWNLTPNYGVNLSKGQIFQVDFSFYGSGLILFKIIESTSPRKRNREVYVHSIDVTGEISLDRPNLKLGVRVDGGTTSGTNTVALGSRQFSVQGEFRPNEKFHANRRNGVSVSSTSWTPLMGVRMDPNAEPLPVSLDEYEILTEVNLDIVVMLDPDISGASWGIATYQSASETITQFDESATLNQLDPAGSVLMDATFVEGGGKNNVPEGSKRANALPTTLPDDAFMYIFGMSKGSDTTSDVIIRVREEF